MKHNWIVTALLIAFFVLAQVVGLLLINKESKLVFDSKTNETVINFDDTAVGARPETRGSGSFIYVLIAIAIGTGLVLLIAKFGKTHIWRLWFFLAVWMALSVSIGVLIHAKIWLNYDIAIVIALILASWKLFRPNIFVHNLTEVLMYAGIGLIIVPLFDVLWVIILLIVISLYDMYAVWKSKHMVKMAEFQTQSRVFAGLMIPYSETDKGLKMSSTLSDTLSDSKVSKKISSKQIPKIRAGKTSAKNAILGGGDIAFPLIFIGTVMNGLMIKLHDANPAMLIEQVKSIAFMQSSIMILTTTIALTLLFLYSKKGRFYPAMPFLTAGCLVGWGIVLLL